MIRTDRDHQALESAINSIAINSANPPLRTTAHTATGEYVAAVNQILMLESALRNFPDLVRQGAREMVANDRECLATQRAVIARVQSDANAIRLANQGGN